MSKPHISLRLLCTGPGGHLEAFGGRKQISVFADHLVLGNVTIYYEPPRMGGSEGGISYATATDGHHLIALGLQDGVLRVMYARRDGTMIEEYFRYEPFLPARSPNTLSDLVAYVNAARVAAPDGSTTAPDSAMAPPDGSAVLPIPPAQPLRYADQLEPDGEWSRVAVHLPRVSFPALCPACGGPVDTVDLLTVHDGASSKRRWLVPVCSEHRRSVSVGGAISIDKWDRKSSDLVFTLFDATYAEAFYRLNACPPEQRESPGYADTPLYQGIADGTRFVVYDYAMSCIFIVSMSTTRPRQLAPGASRLLPAVVPTLITLLFGWWAFPGGPIATIGALIVNLRGGIDLTDDVADVLKGVPYAP